MKYDSLLLNCGGGIINPATRSPQFSGAAALCIGIGGTGIAALSDLKGKIYQQLTPDNPGEPVPRYDAIQLLGIDSDDGAYQNYSGNRRLNKTEFFSIKQDNLAENFTKPQGKQLIKDDPMMNWMEIDEITALLSPEGAGGIRQMGRYLLLSKASSLYTEISNKCRLALKTRGSKSLDIYIFAGISGGTGSGCFLDTCYLVRKVVDANGWNAKIMGYFFLPDVVTSKSEVSSNPASIAYNNSNGYAAMKELDYLMHLEENGDEFIQNYGSGNILRTKQPPVDMCHLISAQKADGSLVPDGFHYGINVASDYAMAYLAEVALNGASADESSLTMRGHLANVTRGVQGIPRRWGANLSYHILGACNAEIPMTQINTYLASGFFQKFAKEACIPRSKVTKNAVQRLMTELQLGVGQVYNAVVSNTRELHLPEIDRRQLASEPVCAKGKLPRTWADYYNNWLAECDGIMVTNSNGLTKKLDGFGYHEVNVQSLVGRLFRRLWDLSVDPAYGPYYAAYLLKNNGDDLFSALTGEIVKADGQEEAKRIQLPDMEEWIIQLNQNLVDRRGRSKDYEAYYRGVTDYLNTEMARLQCHKTASVLREFRTQVEELYNTFFRPLTEMLDNLLETFRENDTYLATDEAKQTNAYTWQILTLDDIKPKLIIAIDKLNVNQLVVDFVQDLLSNSAHWLKNDENNIAMQIRKYMLDLFKKEASRSLQDYLFDKYPETQGDINLLTTAIENNILQRVHSSAIPMFWCDPTYKISDPTYTFESSSLSVPSSCSAICSAANNFNQSHSSYTVRQTGIEDRIFALRFISGIPLFAYQGITKLKGDYDAAAGKAAGAGSHLYSATGRGDSYVDWRHYIPTPMPYSKKTGMEMHSEGEHWAAVYRDAVNRGIIGVVPKDTFQDAGNAGSAEAAKASQNETYAIFMTPALEVKDYTVQDFVIGEVFDEAKYHEELAKIRKQIEELHDFTKNPDCKVMRLKNDGDKDLCRDVESVRIDYFVQYTVMHKIVLKEIEKDAALKAAEQNLVDIYDEYFGYDTDLKNFTTLLFRGIFECRNISDELDYEQTQSVLCCYEDRYGDAQQHYLVKNAEEFALCRAFESYRQRLNGNSDAWEMLEKTLEELKDASTKAQDVYAAAILEKIWDDRAMAKLKDKGLQGKEENVKQVTLRFYRGLRANIKKVKESLGKNWPKDKTVEELTALISGEATVAAAAAAPMPAEVNVWYNGEWMKVYPYQWPDWAVNPATNNWIKLNPAVQVWNGQMLVPIQLDENNRIKF